MKQFFKRIFEKETKDLEGMEFQYSIPDSGFEAKLKKKFIATALGKENEDLRNRKFNTIGLSFLSILIFFSLFYSALSFYNSNENKVNASRFIEITESNPQSALMPVFASLNKYSGDEIDIAMNISKIPFNKDSFGTKTITTLEYGESFEVCNSIFKFDKTLSKIVTFEFYEKSTYKFKTHIFNTEDEEIDVLIYNGKEYFSSKRDLIDNNNTEIISKIESFIPEDLEVRDSNLLFWKERINCNGKDLEVVNEIKFEDSKLVRFSVFVNNTDIKNLVYTGSFEISEMTMEELISVDQIFKNID